MAHISRNVFKRVVACDPYLIDGDFPAYVERARRSTRLFARSRRRVAAHAAQRGDARHDRRAVLRARCKPGAYLVNTARGAVVDVDAAARARSTTGTLAGAALDVLPDEPVPRELAAARAIRA